MKEIKGSATGHTVIVVWQVTRAQGKLRHSRRRDAGTSGRVTDETAVAATGRAGRGSRVGGEVAVGTTLYNPHHDKYKTSAIRTRSD